MDSSSVVKGDTSSSLSLSETGPITTTVAVNESIYFTGHKLWLINAGLIIPIFLVTLESTVISTAIVDITDELCGYSKSSWLFTAYMLTYCSKFPTLPFSFLTHQSITPGLQMIRAKLSDITGRKYTIVTALLIFTIFSTLCGTSQTLIQLIMFRWCQGISGCGVFALV
jgi:MFS family permease